MFLKRILKEAKTRMVAHKICFIKLSPRSSASHHQAQLEIPGYIPMLGFEPNLNTKTEMGKADSFVWTRDTAGGEAEETRMN